eukprot:9178317-Alexandrium_andersonii.AAC.1
MSPNDPFPSRRASGRSQISADVQPGVVASETRDGRKGPNRAECPGEPLGLSVRDPENWVPVWRT